ncbi:M15 family metallopeptidase [Robertkochia flava]|uniref:M15 family metallopeptidase n=1 Tax=Robertkochia flava TaxID=3447986 RepID=UPI001CCC1498|nr:M15 family metallopeptidase [Robertkochia marina]
MHRNLIFISLFTLFVFGCKNPSVKSSQSAGKGNEESLSLKQETKATAIPVSLEDLPDTAFVRLADYSKDFVYDLKYATTDNFIGEKVYDCDECYTRVSTAKALIEVNQAFMEQGFRIKFFDCYRPHSIQKKMWEIYPNPTYVADPAKGSIHNKGGAVDITLVNIDGEELDMGTTFDFFGKAAHHAYSDLPEEVLSNRILLKSTMESYGFNAITSEWWHYNFGPTLNYGIADFVWDCK